MILITLFLKIVMEGCVNMSHDMRASTFHLNGKAYTIQESENTFSGVTYEPSNTSFLYWFFSNPYRFGFYFLLGMCVYLLFFR